MLGTLHAGCRPRTVRGAAGALVLAATVLAAAPAPAGAVLDGYRVSVAVTDGVLIVEEKSCSEGMATTPSPRLGQ
jgi:hypothetical protein